MQVLEKTIEDSVDRHAKKSGIISRKMNGLGNRAWPDRMFLYRGRVLFIEFKRLGEKPTPLQAHFHQMLVGSGFTVYVIDDADSGKQVIENFIRGIA